GMGGRGRRGVGALPGVRVAARRRERARGAGVDRAAAWVGQRGDPGAGGGAGAAGGISGGGAHGGDGLAGGAVRGGGGGGRDRRVARPPHGARDAPGQGAGPAGGRVGGGGGGRGGGAAGPAAARVSGVVLRVLRLSGVGVGAPAPGAALP